MKTTLIRTLAAALALLAGPVAFAQITIGNVRAAQRPGTKLVDIDYDLTGIATPCTVWLEISGDGGTTWAVPTTSAAGAVGTNVTPATDLRITWDAGLDWNGQTSAHTRFRVKASDLLPDLADFATIPGGNFQMGDALDGLSDAPVHTVNLTAYYIAKKEVTKALWDEVRAWGVANGYTDLAAGGGKGTDHPVQTITWWDAVKWCNARSEREGLIPCYYTDAAQTVVFRSGNPSLTPAMVKWSANGFRLPTEAEWEKAARGGLAGLRFPWGNTISHSQANYTAQPGSYPYDVSPTSGNHPAYATGGTPYTSPVCSFAANGYGIFDQAGNIWEWCWDWYDNGYYGTSPSIDPPGPTSGTYRVRRGGGWSLIAPGCRSAARNDGSPGVSSSRIGFRPVRR